MDETRSFDGPNDQPAGDGKAPGTPSQPSAAQERTLDNRQPTAVPTGDAGTLLTAGSMTQVLPPEAAHDVAVPGYEMLGELGRGGMGVVYKARQLNVNRMVALKMILGHRHADLQDKMRFQIEAEAVAGLQHPNIVQLHEVGEHDGLPFFSLEFCAGGSLDQRLKKEPLTAAAASDLVETLARAMHYAHLRGVVHRDLKPANVLLAADGTPKITDFGLAKKMDAGSDVSRTGTVMGTPSYMAPEQAAGKVHDTGPAADVYALGALLYELLAGRPPFRGGTTFQTIELVLTEEPVPPARLRQGVPRDLETICLKCLEKDPARRYGSAEKLADDLRRYRNGEPVAARPVGRFERARKWARRHPAATVATLTTLLIAVAAFALVTWKWFEADAARTATTRALAAEEIQRREAVRLGAAEETQRREAERLGGEAVEAARISQQATYDSYMERIGDEWDRGKLTRVEQTLALCPRELRGWEWHYWQRRLRAPLLTFRADESGVNGLAVSPDGRLVATAGGDEKNPGNPAELRVWDLAANQRVLTCPHQYAVSKAVFSPNGRFIASAAGWMDLKGVGTEKKVFDTPPRGEIKVWDSLTGKEIWAQDGFGCVAFSPDGKWVAAGSVDRSVSIRDSATGKQIATLEPKDLRGWPSGVAFSPDGRQLLVSFLDMPKPFEVVCVKTIWTVADRKLQFILDGAQSPAVFSPDGMTLATGGDEGRILLWDRTTGKRQQSLRGHRGALNGLAYDADGQRLASSGTDHLIRVWDTDTGRELFSLLGHGDEVRDLAFLPGQAPGARRLLSSGRDGTVQLWDAVAGQEPLDLKAQKGPINALAFSPDDRLLATANFKECLVRIQDAATGREVARLPDCPGMTAVFSPDGETLAIGCRFLTLRGERGELVLWKWRSGQPPVRLRDHTRAVLRLAFRPDGRALVSASGDAEKATPGEVILWDLPGGTKRAVLPTPKNMATGVAYSGDGRWLAVSDAGGKLRLCDGATGDLVREWKANTYGIVGIAFNPAAENKGASQLASMDVDGETIVWEATTARQLLRFRTAPTDVVTSQHLVFSPDGERLASIHTTERGDGSELHLWNARTGRRLLTLPAMVAASFTHDGQRLAAVASRILRDDGAILIWDGTPGPEVFSLNASQGPINHVAADAEGRLLAASHSNGRLVVWNAREGRELPDFIKHTGVIYQVALSQAGRLLATGEKDGTVRIWDLRDGKQLHRLTGHEGPAFSLAFSADGKWLASGGSDRSIRVWETAAGKEEAKLEGHAGFIRSLAFGPDEGNGPPLLASSGSEKVVLLWKVRAGLGVPVQAPFSHILELAFSPDGTLLVGASADSTIPLWDVKSGRVLRVMQRMGPRTQAGMTVGHLASPTSSGPLLALGPLHAAIGSGHSRAAHAVTFHPDGKVLASASLDGTIRLWETATGLEYAVLRGHVDAVRGIAFTANGRRLVSCSLDGTVKVWETPEYRGAAKR